MSSSPIIVVLDGATLNPGDLSWQPLEEMGQLTVYDRTLPKHIVERAKAASILLVNKVQMTREIIGQLPNLRFIAITATGFNNVDLDACRDHSVRVVNAVGYGSTSVAQHVFALLLELTNRVGLHSASVKAGDWASQPDFCYWKSPIVELAGKTMGIYGLGSIGQAVARLALAFGMKVLATHRHPGRDAMEGVTFVDLDTLFAQSDVVSLNVPLSEENEGIVDAARLQSMKPTSYLINTARGGLIVEADLAEALRQKNIAGAALDVLGQEPPASDHPFYELENCLITPHQAWASQESRQRLMDMTVERVAEFVNGKLGATLEQV
jgi:glycerate dehydrogenase